MPGILLVLAHPDDESFVGGGVLTKYHRAGLPVALITLTDGQAGRRGVTGEAALADADTIGALRREESRRAAEILEIPELIQPGWMDGQLAQVPNEEGIRFLAGHIRRLKPDVLISFGPEGGGNGHPDHRSTWRWCEGAFDLAADPLWTDGQPPHGAKKHYWITWPRSMDHLRGIPGSEATTIVALPPGIVERKRRAFAEHRSQQDHQAIHEKVLQYQEGKEYFHLGKCRVPRPEGLEKDLMEGIAGRL